MHALNLLRVTLLQIWAGRGIPRTGPARVAALLGVLVAAQGPWVPAVARAEAAGAADLANALDALDADEAPQNAEDDDAGEAAPAPRHGIHGLRAPPPTHRADLIVPEQNQDHSAYRYDSEIFGWSSDFRQLGTVSMDVSRGPNGRHTGEAYMLVYRVGEWLPIHNIICHNITHVDLPENPVPLDEAKDYLWAIESSYLAMWPRRPRRKPRAGDMAVTPLLTFLPDVFALPTPVPEPVPALPKDAPALARMSRQAHQMEQNARLAELPPLPPLATSAPAPAGTEFCRPWVGYALRYQKKRRLQPFVPLDMRARCDVLRASPQLPRIYWGRADVAASMVRVDFSRHESNEQSARFATSAAWRLAALPSLSLPRNALPKRQMAALLETLRSQGAGVSWGPAQGTGGPLRARGARAWLPWAAYLAQAHALQVVRYVVDESLGAQVELRAAEPGDATRPATYAGPNDAAAAAAARQAAPVPPAHAGPRGPVGAAPAGPAAAKPEGEAAKAPGLGRPVPDAPDAPDGHDARYIQDWRP